MPHRINMVSDSGDRRAVGVNKSLVRQEIRNKKMGQAVLPLQLYLSPQYNSHTSNGSSDRP